MFSFIINAELLFATKTNIRKSQLSDDLSLCSVRTVFNEVASVFSILFYKILGQLKFKLNH